MARIKPPSASHSLSDMLPAINVAPDVVYAAAVVTLSDIVLFSHLRDYGWRCVFEKVSGSRADLTTTHVDEFSRSLKIKKPARWLAEGKLVLLRNWRGDWNCTSILLLCRQGDSPEGFEPSTPQERALTSRVSARIPTQRVEL